MLHDTYPALTPLIAEPAAHASLAGVSLNVRLRAKWRGKSAEASGGFLFTHRGYSGPSVLDLSHIAVRSRMNGDEPAHAAVFRVAWSAKDAANGSVSSQRRRALVVTTVARHLPHRLAAYTPQGSRHPSRSGSCRIAPP